MENKKTWTCPELKLYSVTLGKKIIIPNTTYTEARRVADKWPGSVVKLGEKGIRKIR